MRARRQPRQDVIASGVDAVGRPLTVGRDERRNAIPSQIENPLEAPHGGAEWNRPWNGRPTSYLFLPSTLLFRIAS